MNLCWLRPYVATTCPPGDIVEERLMEVVPSWACKRCITISCTVTIIDSASVLSWWCNHSIRYR